MIFSRTMIEYQKELQAKYDVSSTIRHRGEKGRKREHGLAMFLKENLPEKYGVATGEIIPYMGHIPSPQCDIIIYDRLSFPIIGKSSITQQVPYEAVYSVIEVKSNITSASLEYALNKFDAIRKLPRCKLKHRPKRGADRSPLFVLFGYELKTSESACLEFFKKGVKEDLFLIALDRGFTIWVEKDKDNVYPFFLPATITGSEMYETLALSFATFLDTLSSIDLGTPSYLDMLAKWE